MSTYLNTLPKDLVQLIISKLESCTTCVDELLYTLMSLANVSDHLQQIVKEFVVLSYYSNEYVDGLTYCNYKGDRIGPSIQHDFESVELLNHDNNGELLPNSYFRLCKASNCFPLYCNDDLYSDVSDYSLDLPDYNKPKMIVDELVARGIEIAVAFKDKVMGCDRYQLLPKPVLMLLNANKKAEFALFSKMCDFDDFEEYAVVSYKKHDEGGCSMGWSVYDDECGYYPH